MERRGVWRRTVSGPDDAGVGRRGPIDVGAAIGTEVDRRVRMIAKRWKASDRGLKGPDRIARLESRNHANRHSRGVFGVRLAVYQPKPATIEYDARQRRHHGPRRKLGRRELGRHVTLVVDLLDRWRPCCGTFLSDPDRVAMKSHLRRQIQSASDGFHPIS